MCEEVLLNECNLCIRGIFSGICDWAFRSEEWIKIKILAGTIFRTGAQAIIVKPAIATFLWANQFSLIHILLQSFLRVYILLKTLNKIDLNANIALCKRSRWPAQQRIDHSFAFHVKLYSDHKKCKERDRERDLTYDLNDQELFLTPNICVHDYRNEMWQWFVII